MWALTGILLSAGCGKSGPAQEEITLATRDGLHLAATVYPAQGEHPPGVLLAPRQGGGRQVWVGFAAFLQAMGYTVLAFDARPTARGPVSILDDAPAAVADLEAGRQALVDKGADPKNLAVIGEELGGTLALYLAACEPSIQAVVVLSPVLELQGVKAEPAIRRLKDCPVLLITAESDAYADTSAAALKAAAPGFAELQRFSGAAQGADLFAYHANAMHQIVVWLRPIIGPATAP